LLPVNIIECWIGWRPDKSAVSRSSHRRGASLPGHHRTDRAQRAVAPMGEIFLRWPAPAAGRICQSRSHSIRKGPGKVDLRPSQCSDLFATATISTHRRVVLIAFR
jgi:hypothetical protein